uniref:Spliceosome-associated protein CWC27 homolog n=1 Tax=Phallusia mammillata TaxID=59560 RepID=A0A6F9D9J7_9ASCI|nr:peptidyl-prolyl cis-trans isomerase CWC27 homolog [Phallusia mammillata]
MSNIYIKEPSTFGKVLLHTSMGDIDVELWSKEAPIACRNFVQLCLEGYYNNVIFHRVVPNFCVQGGDPTGTGQGGESVFGKPFKDEFHSRLRFVRRGLVAMANSGPDDNGSQFFFTLGPCNDLNKKHTIFGKVTGDTVYNLVRLGEVGTTDDERPINPPFIKWTKVLANPFDDIEPRVDKQKLEEKAGNKKKKKSQMKATKDFKLLSFGEEAEEEEIETKQFDENIGQKSKSSHDVLNDPKLSARPAIEAEESTIEKRKHDEVGESDSEDSSGDSESSGEEEKSGRVQRIKDKLKSKHAENKKLKTEEQAENESFGKEDKSEELKKESKRLAREILKSRRRGLEALQKDDKRASDSSGDDEEDNLNPLYADYKQQQKKYREKTSKNTEKGSSRESATLAMLNSFKTKMFSMREEAGWEDENHDGKDEEVENKDQELEDEEDDSGWLLHRLKHTTELRDAKDVNREVTEDRFDISDPRNPLNQRRREKSSKKHKDSRERSHRSERHRR